MSSKAPWPRCSGLISAGTMTTSGGIPSSMTVCPGSSFPPGIAKELKGLEKIIFYSSIWTPDIFLFNDATGSFSDSLVNDEKSWDFAVFPGQKNLFKFIELITPVNFSLIPFLYVKDNPLLVVTSEGHVRWIPPLVVKYIWGFCISIATIYLIKISVRF